MRKVMMAAAAATTVGLASGLVGAQAADMSLPPLYQSEPEPMVEFGSGWYLRGDLGYATMSVPMGSPPTTISGASSPTPPSVFSNRTAQDGVLATTIGAGYQFNRWFRMDATFDWRANQNVKIKTAGLNCALDVSGVLTDNGSCYKVDGTQIQTWTGLLNAYGDLGTWWGATPYIGGGIGLTNVRASASEDWYWSYGAPYGGAGHNLYQSSAAGIVVHYGYPGDVGPSQVRTNFSFALMAGVAYDLAPHLKFDLGYRYLNMGSLSVTDNSGNVVRKTLDAQEVRAGLRWTPDL